MGISTASSVLLSSTILSVTTMDFDSHWLWALVLAFHLSFLFAFAMGANEVSNAFATSVGSGAISLFTAYFLATFFESAGGVLLGYKVLETLRFKVIDLEVYEGAQEEFLLGQIAILAGCSLWMFLATLLRLPVSSTHAHVGSIIGFSLFMRGTKGLHLDWVFTIIISWIVSPILSGIVSAILYILMDFWVLRRKEPLKRAFQALPIIYFLVFAFNTFIVLYQGTKCMAQSVQ
uniref:Phosphate transporter n=1 Tax=Acrobeloides nanus TaxID=290746 RepID=A0A914CVL8_9BILA